MDEYMGERERQGRGEMGREIVRIVGVRLVGVRKGKRGRKRMKRGRERRWMVDTRDIIGRRRDGE